MKQSPTTMEQSVKEGKLAWISELSPPERSTLVATFGGWALDGMDVMVYSFVIPSLIAAWQLSRWRGRVAGYRGAAKLCGGRLAGRAAGRSASAALEFWSITIVWFALFTFLSGFTNSFWGPAPHAWAARSRIRG